MRPRRTSVRLRLTMGYSILFVAAFGAVLAASYFLVKDRTGGSKTALSIICTKNGHVQAEFVGAGTGAEPGANGGQAGVSASVPAGNSSAPAGSGFSRTCARQVINASSQTLVYHTVTAPPQASTNGFVPVGTAPPDPLATLIEAVNASRDHTLNTFVIESVLALGLMAILSIGLGWWMAGRALKPVHRITDTARRLSEQTLHDRINLEGPRDEVKELADTFDGMLARLDQAFTSQRRFVANASHELRTPLATERVLVDEALANPDATVEELKGILEQIRTNSEESERLINALLNLARSGRSIERWSTVDLAGVAQSAQDRGSAEATAKGIELRSELCTAPSRGDPGLLDRVAGNLVENAIRHNVPGGWLLARTGTEAGRAFLEVSNSGPVIEASEVQGLIEPFRRAGRDRSSKGEGFGLGLSIVDAIVSAHGGRLSVQARSEGGLHVRAELREDDLPATQGSPSGGSLSLSTQALR